MSNNYFLSGKYIRNVEHIKDLRLIVDNRLRFDLHIEQLRKKAYKTVNFFKVFHSRDKSLYIKAYNAYVLPIIDYSAIFYVFSSKSNISMIEKIQKYFTRILYRKLYHNLPTPEYLLCLQEFSLQPISALFGKADLLTLFKIANGTYALDGFDLRYSKSRSYRILLPTVRTALYKNSFFHRPIVFWNYYVKSSFTSVESFASFLSTLSF